MLVEPGNLLPQPGMALAFGIAQPQPLPKFQAFGSGHCQQFGHRQAFAVGWAQQVFNLEFVQGKVAFQSERGYCHGFSIIYLVDYALYLA